MDGNRNAVETDAARHCRARLRTVRGHGWSGLAILSRERDVRDGSGAFLDATLSLLPWRTAWWVPAFAGMTVPLLALTARELRCGPGSRLSPG
jgi:hypothetical protein